MLPRELFRTDPDAIRAALEARHTDAPLDRLLEVDQQWRGQVVRLDELRARRNAGSKEVGALFRDGRQEEAEAKRAEMSALGDEIKTLEESSRQLEEELQALELTIPNLVDPSVPTGADEGDNRVERQWGEVPDLVFLTEAGKMIHSDIFRRREFKRALEKAGLRKIRIHDLRHSYASQLIQAGESLAYIRDQLGHHSIKVTVDVYGHLAPEGNKSAVDRLDDGVPNSQQSATLPQPLNRKEASHNS